MATDEPAQRKPKLDETTEDITPKVEGKTFFVLEEGRFVPVKYVGGGYVSPPPCASDDNDVDPAREAEYNRQIRESGGFDCDLYIPNGSLFPFKCLDTDEDDIAISTKLGLHWYNFQKGTNFRLLRLQKYNSILNGICTYYITADAIDPASNSGFVFHTCVTRCSNKNNEDLRLEYESCRIKPETQGGSREDENSQWNYEAIDEFYKDELKWLPDDALVQSSDKHQECYEVQHSDIRENDWLNLYAEYALFTLWENGLTKLNYAAPLEINKVVVQTREAMETKEKLKAGNAVFYICFRDCGLTEDHRAMVRRTTDGRPGHACLEVKCPIVDSSSCSTD